MNFVDDYLGSSHMAGLLDPDLFCRSLDLAGRLLATIIDQFDSIAFRGMSGAVIAGALAVRLKKPLILVRKPYDVTHSCFQVEGNKAVRRYLIVDDFICSGETVGAIKKAIESFAPEAECIGVFQFQDGGLIGQGTKPLLHDGRKFGEGGMV